MDRFLLIKIESRDDKLSQRHMICGVVQSSGKFAISMKTAKETDFLLTTFLFVVSPTFQI